VREYLVELERENPVEAPVAQQEKLLTTDSGLDLRGQKRSAQHPARSVPRKRLSVTVPPSLERLWRQRTHRRCG
jgi:hypothetical protein